MDVSEALLSLNVEIGRQFQAEFKGALHQKPIISVGLDLKRYYVKHLWHLNLGNLC